MHLAPGDVGLLFRLHRSLMFFVNQRLEVIPERPADPEKFSSLAPAVRIPVRDALLKHMDLLQTFVDENPARLSQDELDIVLSWRHLVHGTFFILRELKKYTVFLSTETPPVAYGVLALSESFEELIGPRLPVMVQTVLLPFREQIVYDGLLSSRNIWFGPGSRRGFVEDFREAKLRNGIVTSLPMSDMPIPQKTPRARPVPKPPSKQDTAEVLGVIIGMTDRFCRENLNAEYAVLCRKLAEKLARKRPSPLLSGSPNAWGSGIVRTVGWVNFLHEKSQTPYMRLGDIDTIFSIGESTGAAKLAAIRKMLKIHQLDPNWSLPSRLADNPMVWMLQVNGFMVDVRYAPREVQQIAFSKGLIPYIPADKGSE